VGLGLGSLPGNDEVAIFSVYLGICLFTVWAG
jgi:hypothetical protein